LRFAGKNLTLKTVFSQYFSIFLKAPMWLSLIWKGHICKCRIPSKKKVTIR
jgi:hypothetical protein